MPCEFECYDQSNPNTPHDKRNDPDVVNRSLGLGLEKSTFQTADTDVFNPPSLVKFHFQALDIDDDVHRNSESTKKKAYALIKKSGDRCGEIYNTLARLASSLEEALEMYRRGLEITSKYMNWQAPDVLDTRPKGDFWSVANMRAYQRSQMGIAVTLMKLGR